MIDNMDIKKLIIDELNHLLEPYRYYTYARHNALYIYNRNCYIYINVYEEYISLVFYAQQHDYLPLHLDFMPIPPCDHTLIHCDRFLLLDPHCLSKIVCLLNDLMISHQLKPTNWYTIKTAIKSIYSWTILVGKLLISKFTH